MKFRALAALICAIALLFAACTNSDDFLYDESEATFIEVSAEMAYSFDSLSERSKIDTLRPGDSLIFIANILPSKSIKIKRYLWTLDGDAFSYDFSFRSAIWDAGEHKVVFLLETFFGDTLSDTLTIHVSNPPVLLDSAFIPAKGTQGIPTTGGISFAWNAYDPDSIAQLYYHFTIDGVVDTLLSEPNFTYWGRLEPLSHYNWHVQAINEFGFASNNTIESNFFTSGGPNESGITGFIELATHNGFTNAFAFNAKVSILDTAGNEIYSDVVKGNTQSSLPFVISPLSAGNYKVAVAIPTYPDFSTDTLDITLSANEVQETNTITLHDTIPPQIAFIGSTFADRVSDTIPYADTLRFLITDFGSPQSQKTVAAYLESTLLNEKAGAGDTFTVVLPPNTKTWNYRYIDIVATDASKNKTIRSFTVEPAERWFMTNSSFTTSDSGLFSLYIIDQNPYGFTTQTCKFTINDNLVIKKSSSGGSICTIRTSTAYLNKGLNTIRSVVEYTNGISQWETWYIMYDDDE